MKQKNIARYLLPVFVWQIVFLCSFTFFTESNYSQDSLSKKEVKNSPSEEQLSEIKTRKGVIEAEAPAAVKTIPSGNPQADLAALKETETQLKVVESMLNYIQTNTNELIPANIIPSEEGAASQINEYNNLVLERNRLLKTAAEKNVLVQNIDNKISALKQNVTSSLKQLKSNLVIKKKDLNRQSAILSGKISQIPTQEKVFKDIFRKQNVKEALYLYLLQKREETAISLAVTAPNAKVIDAAKASKSPVSPNRRMIYLAALLLGGLIPFGILYLIDLFDTKIKSRYDLEKNTTIPFLGEIPIVQSIREAGDYGRPAAMQIASPVENIFDRHKSFL